MTIDDQVRILAVGDHFVPSTAYLEAANARGDGRLRLVVAELGGDKESQHTIQQQTENHGIDSVEPPSELFQAIREAQVLVVHFAPVPRGLLERAAALELVVVARNGLENVDLDYAKHRGIGVVNVHGRNANAVAELAVGLMIAESRNLARAHTSVVTGGWRKSFPLPSRELTGRCFGLVGFGAVGICLAARLRGFDPSEILVYDPYADQTAVTDLGGKTADLETVLRRGDFISLQARLSAETQHLIDEEQLSWMKPDSYLINVGRSRLVNTQALCRALEQGRLAGAGLDVFDDEPLGEHDPLRSLDNVTLTTHFGGDTLDTNIRSAGLALEAVVAWLDTSPTQRSGTSGQSQSAD